MSKTPSERQTGIETHAGAQVGPVEANARTTGSRSLQAGGEFLKALASDLAAVASRLRRSLLAKPQRTLPPRAPAPARVSQRRSIGDMLWRLTVVLLALGTISAGALCAVTLWVLFGSPLEPRRSTADALGSSIEARTGEPIVRGSPLKVGDASRQDFARVAGAQGLSGSSSADAAEPKAAKQTQTEARAGTDQPQLVPTDPQERRSAAGQQDGSRTLTESRPRISFDARKGEPLGRSGPLKAGDDSRQGLARGAGEQGLPGSSSADAAERKVARETRTEARAGADQHTEPQDRRPAAGQQDGPRTLTDSGPRTPCNLDRCAARYTSFHAVDCTYQPHGGGPRQICELSTRTADARPEMSRAPTDTEFEAKDRGTAERTAEVAKSATPARPEGQCKVDLCAAKYGSFRAADCTYQPHGGGPRRICEK